MAVRRGPRRPGTNDRGLDLHRLQLERAGDALTRSRRARVRQAGTRVSVLWGEPEGGAKSRPWLEPHRQVEIGATVAPARSGRNSGDRPPLRAPPSGSATLPGSWRSSERSCSPSAKASAPSSSTSTGPMRGRRADWGRSSTSSTAAGGVPATAAARQGRRGNGSPVSSTASPTPGSPSPRPTTGSAAKRFSPRRSTTPWMRGDGCRTQAGGLGVDAGRTYLWGASAGGNLAALAGLVTEASGGRPASCAGTRSRTCSPSTSTRPTRSRRCSLGGADRRAPRAGPGRQPGRPTPGRTPHRSCIQHGGADTWVPSDQSVRLADALRAVRSRVELEIVPGADHFFDGAPDVEAIFERAARVPSELDGPRPDELVTRSPGARTRRGRRRTRPRRRSAAAPDASHSSSVTSTSPGTRCESTSVPTPARAAISPTCSGDECERPAGRARPRSWAGAQPCGHAVEVDHLVHEEVGALSQADDVVAPAGVAREDDRTLRRVEAERRTRGTPARAARAMALTCTPWSSSG